MAIKVLIVDDSALVRQVLSDIIKAEPGFVLIGTANDGEEALNKINSLRPDVVTLDIEMPRLNGLECLAKIMANSPLPVIMVSYLSVKGAEVTMKAFELGAVDFITKPSPQAIDTSSLNLIKQELIQKIKTAAGVNLNKLKEVVPVGESPKAVRIKKNLNLDLVAIGSSTGGPKALYYLLSQLPKDFPLGVVVAQHMPKDFTAVFAKRLNDFCALEVTEAKTGDLIEPGKVLIAPSGYQTKIIRVKDSLQIVVSEEPRLILKPSVDYLFSSLAESCKGRVLGIILTGMGSDGSHGMSQLRNLGARTIAQDEESCVVYGMPRAAVEAGGVEFVESLTSIYSRIITILNE